MTASDLDLNDLMVFTRVVEARSFTAAAKGLSLPTSTVSRRVARLEKRLGVRLMTRTTRKLSLTEAGRMYYERGARAVAEIEDAERAVAEMRSVPRGKLRVTAPSDAGGHLSKLVEQFLSLNDEVQVELVLTERFMDLIDEGIDVALRGGSRPESSIFTARKLVESKRVLVASPTYLERHGKPERPEELREHHCVIFTPWAPQSTWTLKGPHGQVQVPIKGRFMTNALGPLKHATLAGFGIAQLLEPLCAEELKAGTLLEVAPGTCLPTGSLWMIYASRRYLTPSVRAFVDFLQANYDPLPRP